MQPLVSVVRGVTLLGAAGFSIRAFCSCSGDTAEYIAFFKNFGSTSLRATYERYGTTNVTHAKLFFPKMYTSTVPYVPAFLSQFCSTVPVPYSTYCTVRYQPERTPYLTRNRPHSSVGFSASLAFISSDSDPDS